VIGIVEGSSLASPTGLVGKILREQIADSKSRICRILFGLGDQKRCAEK
jgi:hypothetical protein